jgi:hypothetical protein
MMPPDTSSRQHVASGVTPPLTLMLCRNALSGGGAPACILPGLAHLRARRTDVQTCSRAAIAQARCLSPCAVGPGPCAGLVQSAGRVGPLSAMHCAPAARGCTVGPAGPLSHADILQQGRLAHVRVLLSAGTPWPTLTTALRRLSRSTGPHDSPRSHVTSPAAGWQACWCAEPAGGGRAWGVHGEAGQGPSALRQGRCRLTRSAASAAGTYRCRRQLHPPPAAGPSPTAPACRPGSLRRWVAVDRAPRRQVCGQRNDAKGCCGAPTTRQCVEEVHLPAAAATGKITRERLWTADSIVRSLRGGECPIGGAACFHEKANGANTITARSLSSPGTH